MQLDERCWQSIPNCVKAIEVELDSVDCYGDNSEPIPWVIGVQLDEGDPSYKEELDYEDEINRLFAEVLADYRPDKGGVYLRPDWVKEVYKRFCTSEGTESNPIDVTYKTEQLILKAMEYAIREAIQQWWVIM